MAVDASIESFVLYVMESVEKLGAGESLPRAASQNGKYTELNWRKQNGFTTSFDPVTSQIYLKASSADYDCLERFV